MSDAGHKTLDSAREQPAGASGNQETRPGPHGQGTRVAGWDDGAGWGPVP